MIASGIRIHTESKGESAMYRYRDGVCSLLFYHNQVVNTHHSNPYNITAVVKTFPYSLKVSFVEVECNHGCETFELSYYAAF